MPVFAMPTVGTLSARCCGGRGTCALISISMPRNVARHHHLPVNSRAVGLPHLAQTTLLLKYGPRPRPDILTLRSVPDVGRHHSGTTRGAVARRARACCRASSAGRPGAAALGPSQSGGAAGGGVRSDGEHFLNSSALRNSRSSARAVLYWS